MRFSVASTLNYAVAQPSTLILNVHAQRTPSQIVVDEQFSVQPTVKVEELAADVRENRFIRIETGNAKSLTVTYKATVDCEHHLVTADQLNAAFRSAKWTRA